jgi:hypothetical protein
MLFCFRFHLFESWMLGRVILAMYNFGDVLTPVWNVDVLDNQHKILRDAM